MHKAGELFDKIPQRNIVSWTAMILGYVKNGFVEKALQTFKQMQVVGVKPNSSTFASILQACVEFGVLELGSHPSKRYGENGFLQKPLENFLQMQLAGVKPNSTTFFSLVPAYTKIGALEQRMNLHQDIIERGFWADVAVGNAISWNGIVARYAQNVFFEKALETFKEMLYKTDVKGIVIKSVASSAMLSDKFTPFCFTSRGEEPEHVHHYFRGPHGPTDQLRVMSM
ncbi:pentatricopeptide repeat-containing protein At1g14470-like [Cryptomeria japonica]|uniref:pentatricopeptide repeat-containing protein At1g14470-like n=1 Tax=Cryptomeria japonica TaxID=3369 RepID=UPI0027DA567A|nr:pentatricopeptide repeat-containing protein At1g14470-like [Cryptomeria japonica]